MKSLAEIKSALKRSLISAGKDTSAFIRTAASPIEGAFNTVSGLIRAPIVTGAAAIDALDSDTFKDTYAKYQQSIPQVKLNFADNAAQELSQRTGTSQKAISGITNIGKFVGSQLPYFAIPSANVERLGLPAATLSRAGEFGGLNFLSSVGEGSTLQEAKKAGITGATTGAISTAIPRMNTIKAGLSRGLVNFAGGTAAGTALGQNEFEALGTGVLTALSGGKVPVRTQQEGVVLGSGTGSKLVGGNVETVSPEIQKAQEYVKQQVKKQNAARNADKKDSGNWLKNMSKIIKTKFVDTTSSIEDIILSETKKQYGKSNLDFTDQLDRTLRSGSIASQFIKDNGMVDVITQADNLDELNQFLIARYAPSLEARGITTGRNAEADKQLIQALGSKYGQLADKVSEYSRRLLDYTADSGLISRELAEKLKVEYPDYVPFNRIFTETEEGLLRYNGGGKGVASQGSQSVVQKIKGSEREVSNPIESLLEKTNTAFRQGERNKAAQIVASYKDLPGNPLSLRKLGKNEVSTGKATISVMEGGKQVKYETTPEIAEAAKHLNEQQLGIIGQIAAIPTRILKLGATGLNIPFVASNLAKDQLFSFINSNRALSTNPLTNPNAFLKAFISVLKKDDLYQEWQRSGGAFTSFDLSRNATANTVKQIRSNKNTATKIGYVVTHPLELLRAVEDLIGKSEEITRLQQFIGTKQGALKEGLSEAEAGLEAITASRANTTNFARRGEYGSALNAVIPYLNAGIQGSRQLLTTLKNNPKAGAAKIATTLFVPAAYITAWNLKDPERKQAYEDIPDYEKENNFIIVPLNPEKDENGNWKVIKVPLTPGLSDLASIVRRGLEGMNGLDPIQFGEIASALFTTATSFDTDPRKLLSQVTPQMLKPGIEALTNQNLFTGSKIVPEYMKNLPPEMQVKDNTSGTARLIGGALNVSPLQVENFVRTSGAGVGAQLLNFSDQALAKTGFIPESQIGGKGLAEAVASRFNRARGGELTSKLYDQIDDVLREKQISNNKFKEAFVNGDYQSAYDIAQTMTDDQVNALVRSIAEQKLGQTFTDQEKAISSLSKNDRLKLIELRPDLIPTVTKVTLAEAALSGSSSKSPLFKTKKLTVKKSKSSGSRRKTPVYTAPKLKLSNSRGKSKLRKISRIRQVSPKLKLPKV